MRTRGKLFSIVGVVLIISIILFSLIFMIWGNYSTAESIKLSLNNQFLLRYDISNRFFKSHLEHLHMQLKEVAVNRLFDDCDGHSKQHNHPAAYSTFFQEAPNMLIFKPDDGKIMDLSVRLNAYTQFLPQLNKMKKSLLSHGAIKRFVHQNVDMTMVIKAIEIRESLFGSGILFGGYVLNQNYPLLEVLKQRVRAEDVLIIQEGDIVVSSSLQESPLVKSLLSFHQSNPLGSVGELSDVIASHFEVKVTDYSDVIIVVTATDKQLLAEAQKSYSIKIIVGLFIIIIFFWSFLFMIKQITFPALRNLTRFADKVKSGEPNVSYQPGRIDEFNELGQTLESVFDKFQSSNEALDRSKQFISDIVNSMPSVIIGVDENGILTHWNTNAEVQTGILKQNAIGRYYADVYGGLNVKMADISRSIESQEIVYEPNQEINFNSKTYFQDISICPLVTDSEKGAVIRIDDVTDRKQLQESLLQSRKMDAIGQLAGGVAHDFNNMLAGIMGAAELLKLNRSKMDEKNAHYVDIILQASVRAANLISKLLAFGRKGKTASIAVNLNSIIEDTVSILSNTIDKKITIHTELSADCSMVVGDDSGLQNALINMGINASHAMPNGGNLYFRTRNIHLDDIYCESSSFNTKPGNYVSIEIQDDGHGIPQQNLSKIFDPFFTTKAQGEGTGLGLAAVFGMVLDHQGAIDVKSEVSVGTTFQIYLPCTKVPAEEECQSEIVISGAGKVLLVDDEELIRMTGKMMLEEIGYDVILAEDGHEAVEIFTQHHDDIQLVVMDMIMPAMNGREAFLKMKEIDPKCKVVISSGFTKDQSTDDLIEKGLCGFIHKPYRYIELSELLSEIINKC